MNSPIDFLTRPEVKKFIRENLNADLSKLLLNPSAEFKSDITVLVNQIQARKKAKGKLDHWANNFDLIMPPPLSIEQASSLATCNYKQNLIGGSHLIDLTGGMGIDCLALSESFDQTTYVEQQATLCEIFEHNSKVLNNEVYIVNSEAAQFLNKRKPNPKQTVIYLDPARRDISKKKVFRIEDCSPDLLELMPKLKESASTVLVKFSPMLDIHAILKSISHIKEIHIVSVRNECKEVLVLIDFAFKDIPQITCVNLESTHPTFTFSSKEETDAKASFGNTEKYIFEPNSSIMKAGGFKIIAQKFNLKKLAENTQLYTSSHLIDGFPGKIFKIISEVNKKNIQDYTTNNKINVISRNHPLTATELKKKWKLKDGGHNFLLAYRNHDNRPQTMIATRLDQ